MKVIVGTTATEYTDQGRGPTLLLLHGWKDDLKTFDKLLKELSSSYRIVRLDMPGFGGTDIPKGTWRVSDYAQFVRRFLEKVHIEPDVIVGHSFGGRVIIRGVGTGELQPKKIVLIAAAGLARKRTWRNRLLSVVAKIGKMVTSIPPLSSRKQELRRTLYEAIGSDYFAAGALKDTFVAVVSEDLSRYAARIKIPTLLIWGSEDASTTLDQGKRIASLIQGSRLEVINGASHFVHVEQPGKVAEFISSFV